MSRKSPTLACLVAVCLLIPGVPGCNLLIPGMILAGPPTKKVEPEFARLAGKRVLVLVWTPPSILTNYPYARYDIAKYVGDALRSEIEDVTTVSSRHVEDYVSKRLDGTTDPPIAGRHFDADVVVYLELLRYRMRLPNTPNLYRGEIEASVVVFDLGTALGEPERYELSGVSVQHPEGAPVSIYNTTEQKLRKETSEIFAQKVALKFKSHRVEL
ncbi:MAG: hypothetical protein JSU68_08410 [Phycisphaerales bacterium]|nr:MAG: hypothetical protein JSU68_08410 [Phycisphaerales bacterium]